MRKIVSTVCAAILSISSVAAVGPTSAAPIRPLEIERPTSDVQQVQYRNQRPNQIGPRNQVRRPNQVRPRNQIQPRSQVRPQVQHPRGFYRYRGQPYYNGHRGYRTYRPGYRRYNDWWFPSAAFITGAIIGGVLATPPPAYGSSTMSDAHVQWCYNRYKSYRAYDNTFQPYNGPRKQCRSPYN